MNVASGPTMPPLRSGPSCGRLPSVATDHQPSREDAARTPETDQASTPPPLPERPSSRGSVPGLRQQSTRQNTNETHTSSFPEKRVPISPQSPGIEHESNRKLPETQVSGQPPPNQARHPSGPAPGGGVGGFALFNDNVTANYAYRFDTIPSPQSDSDHHHYESEDVTGGVHEKVWPIYNKISEEHDDKMLKKWNSDLDTLLIFVSVAFGLNR